MVRQKLVEESLIVDDRFERYTLDQCMELIGTRGRYQYILTIVMILQYIFVAFVFMSPGFYLVEPQFQCEGSDKLFTETDGGCAAGCSIYHPSGTRYMATMTETYGLYCENKYLRDLSISLMYVGVFIGNLLVGYFGDKHGRKRVVVVSWFLGSLGVLLLCFDTNYWVFLSGMIFVGLTLWPPLNFGMILVNEQSDTTFRQYACLFMMMSFGIGTALLAVIVYYIPHWQVCFMLCFFLPCFLLNIQGFLIQDSPQFWISRSVQKTKKYLNRISAMNRKDLHLNNDYDIIDEFENIYNDSRLSTNLSGVPQEQEAQPDETKLGYLDLFRHKRLRYITLGSCFFGITLQVIFFGSQFALSQIGLNVYYNTIVAGLSQVVVLVPSMFFIPKIRRKLWLFIFQIISVMFCFSYLFIEDKTFQTVNAGIIKAANRVCLSIYSIYVNEVYPASVRSIGNGINFSISQIGSTVAPILVGAATESTSLSPMFFVGLVGASSLITFTLFQETLSKKLTNSLIEFDQQTEPSKPAPQKTPATEGLQYPDSDHDTYI